MPHRAAGEPRVAPCAGCAGWLRLAARGLAPGTKEAEVGWGGDPDLAGWGAQAVGVRLPVCHGSVSVKHSRFADRSAALSFNSPTPPFLLVYVHSSSSFLRRLFPRLFTSLLLHLLPPATAKHPWPCLCIARLPQPAINTSIPEAPRLDLHVAPHGAPYMIAPAIP